MFHPHGVKQNIEGEVVTITVEGRVLEFPATPDGNPAIRVDLKYLLTKERPYTRSYLNYLADELGVPDYGIMLSQQLRRIDGVSTVGITHYGCKVEIGALYDMRAMNRTVRRVVELVLATETPWTVGRPKNNSNWTYRFAKPLIANPLSRVDVSTGAAHLAKGVTDFGRRVLDTMHTNLGAPWLLFPHHALIDISGDQDWPSVDAQYDGIAAKVAGRRDLTISWD